jgi:hypothetical protein
VSNIVVVFADSFRLPVLIICFKMAPFDLSLG